MDLLLIDDEAGLRRTLRTTLESMRHNVSEAGSGEQALNWLSKQSFDVAFLDLRLGREAGIDLLPQLLRQSPKMAVVVITAHASIASAVEAMRAGAFDYLPKPFTPDQLRVVLERWRQLQRLRNRVANLEEQVRAATPQTELLTEEPLMRQALDLAFQVAASEATVLLRGESGTGKGVLARAIHERSPRAAGPFVVVHCPSLSGDSTRLLRAQRTSQAVIDSFPEPILVVDPNGGVEMANPAAHRLLGPPSTAPGQAAAYTWLPPPALRQPLDDALHHQRPFRTQAFDETVVFRSNGEDRAYLPQILPIQDPFGFTLGAAVVLNDVTRFRLLDQIKSDLVATASHELKTPLASVRLVLHLLLEETVGSLTPKQTELLIDARDNAKRLLNTIQHLLALARLEEGREQLQIQAIAPQELLQAAAEKARPQADSKSIQLVVEEAAQTPPVAADPIRLGYALDNLLDNALTYTDSGGRITLSAVAVDGSSARLSIADTGVGIPAEHLPHVFNKFFRVPGQERGQGTGLGLAIVREIVLAHGGQVSCTSTVGQGTVFHLTLPIWRAADALGGGTT